jgi:hypothetical protein
MTKRGDEWWKDEGVLFFNKKMLVPHVKNLRERVISQHHNTPITSHTGINGTIQQITGGQQFERMYRPIYKDVKYAKGLKPEPKQNQHPSFLTKFQTSTGDTYP